MAHPDPAERLTAGGTSPGGPPRGAATPGARAAAEALADSSAILAAVARDWAGWADAVATELVRRLKAGKKLLTCGNGGSAADAQHIATELAGSFYFRDRMPLPAIALTTNTSVLTAVANDHGYDDVFARQIGSIGQRDDVLLAITTSGGSPSVRAAVSRARALGLWTVGFTGERGASFAEGCDTALVVPSADVARIQEAHIAVGHVICALVERAMAGLPVGARAPRAGKEVHR